MKRVDELGFYSLGLKQLAEKLGLTQPKTLALVRRLGIQESEELFTWIIHDGGSREIVLI